MKGAFLGKFSRLRKLEGSETSNASLTLDLMSGIIPISAVDTLIEIIFVQ